MYRPRVTWRAAALHPFADPDWVRKLGTAGLVLLIPVIGWPMLLGYRKEAIFRLIRGDEPILPAWPGNYRLYLAEGLKAVGVINAYFLPVYLWLAYRLATDPHAGHVPVGWVLAVALFAPIVSTLVVPALLISDRLLGAPAVFGWGESLAITTAFGLLTFLVPSGFQNVSRTGRYLSAFDLPRAVGRIARCPVTYLEAWAGSGLLSLAGHFCGVFAPWGVAWCYLAIVYAFNELPLAAGDREAVALKGSWFERLRSTDAG